MPNFHDEGRSRHGPAHRKKCLINSVRAPLLKPAKLAVNARLRAYVQEALELAGARGRE